MIQAGTVVRFYQYDVHHYKISTVSAMWTVQTRDTAYMCISTNPLSEQFRIAQERSYREEFSVCNYYVHEYISLLPVHII
jgi:hypothetical protein